MIDQIILALCLNLQTPDLTKYYAACTNALTAASIQSKIKPEVDKYQHDLEKKVYKEVTQETGERIWQAGGLVYALAIKRQLAGSISAKPIADNLNLTIGSDSGNMTLTWSF